MEKRIFDAALRMVLQEAFRSWEDDANTIEIDLLGVWDLFGKLQQLLLAQHQNPEPINFPRVRDMTLREFIDNMNQAYGFTS